MKQLNEESKETQEILEGWRKEAKEMTLENLPTFLKKITEDYRHDYGTICHAVSISGVATMWAINHSKQGGITGFQASAIMWENIKNWDSSYKNKPLRLVDYSNMLYPQYEHVFSQTINSDTMTYLQTEAKKNLTESPNAHGDVIRHWEKLADGKAPFGYTIEDD